MAALTPTPHPSLSNAELNQIAAPDEGDTIWNSDALELQTWNGVRWISSTPPVSTQPRIGVVKVQSITAGVPLTISYVANLQVIDDVKIRSNTGEGIGLQYAFGGTTVTVMSNVSLTNIQVTAEGPPA